MRSRSTFALFCAAVAFQAVIVGLVPARKIWTRATGRPVLLKLAPVDPYSVISGYYADLNYEISSPGSFPKTVQPQLGETVYALLAPGADGAMHPAQLLTRAPSALAPGEACIRGKYATGRWGRQAILYGIESFYFPEARREEVNSAMRRSWTPPPPQYRPAVGPPKPAPPPPLQTPAFAEIRVDGSGRAALVALKIGDKRFE